MLYAGLADDATRSADRRNATNLRGAMLRLDVRNLPSLAPAPVNLTVGPSAPGDNLVPINHPDRRARRWCGRSGCAIRSASTS